MRFSRSHHEHIRPRQLAYGLVFLICAAVGFLSSSVFAQMLTVTSTNDAHGLYTYTFSRGSSSYVWGLSTNGDAIYMQSYGVIEVIPPAGWDAAVQDNGQITWSVTNGLVYLDNPVTFSVRSSFAVSRNYTTPPPGPATFPQGLLVADAYQPPNPESQGLGFEYFSFVGPDPTQLTIQRVNQNVVISWYSGLSSLQLQATTNLSSSAGWQVVTNAPVTIGGQSFVTNSIGLTPRFYRLSGN